MPEWRAHNLDYNEIKHLIKVVTSRSGSSLGAGSGDDVASADERALQNQKKVVKAMDEEFESISLFVQLKSGEIERRLADCNRLVQQLAKIQKGPSSNGNAQMSKQFQQMVYRLHQAAGALARDTQNLSRFVAAQHIGFRKLIKKFRKWTPKPEDQSEDPMSQFQVKLESPTSFVNCDFASKFLELSLLYDALRNEEFTPVKKLSEQLPSESLLRFDCEMITSLATGAVRLLVHDDSLMEVSLTLVRELESLSSPSSAKNNNKSSSTIYLDTPKLEFAHVGKEPAQIRSIGTRNTRALCCPTGGLRNFSTTQLDENWYHKILTGKPINLDELDANNRLPIGWLSKKQCRPYIECNYERMRYTNAIENNKKDLIWAAMDSRLSLAKYKCPQESTTFPFSLLEIHWTHDKKPNWIAELEQSSHLVQLMPADFSLYAYSIIDFYGEQLGSIPRWYKDLKSGQDFRQSGPPITPRTNTSSASLSNAFTSSSSLTNIHKPYRQHGSTSSLINMHKPYRKHGAASTSVCSSTATTPPAILIKDNDADYFTRQLDSAGQQRRPNTARKELGSPQQLRVRYWNEFDDGDEFDNESNAFVVIPEEDSSEDDKVEKLVRASDKLLTKVRGIFSPGINERGVERQLLLPRRDSSTSSLSEGGPLVSHYSPRLRPVQSYSTIAELDENGLDGEWEVSGQNARERRDSVLTFMYLLCFTLSALTIVTLLAAIMSEDMDSVSISTIVVLTAGLTFSLLLGLLGMVFFLSRDVAPAWWHQTFAMSAFFTIVCFGVGGIAFVLS